MTTNVSRPRSLALVSSGSGLILDSAQSARRSLRVAETALVALESAAATVHAAAARGELGDVLALASAVGQTCAAVEPLRGLRDALNNGLEELGEGLAGLLDMPPEVA